MRLKVEAELEYRLAEPVDLLLAIEAAPLADQHIVEDRLTVNVGGPLRPVSGDDQVGRRTWMRARDAFRASYAALIEVAREPVRIDGLARVPLPDLPAPVVPYLWPSRYCEADRFDALVRREFGDLDGGAKVRAMADWIFDHLEYRAGTSDAATTAVDAYVGRQGVCRDFAHLLASFARAADIPARCVSAYAWKLDPPDFHAVVEVWLDGAWRLIDPTRLAPTEGLVRIAAGRDATDIAFMTVFGAAELVRLSVSVERVDAATAEPPGAPLGSKSL